jgi:hypothetical protein
MGRVERAHSSTIRDIALVGSSAVVSVGADQRVNLWALPMLQLLGSCLTEVCDTSCVDASALPIPPADAAAEANAGGALVSSAARKEVVVLVGGMGVQVLRFSV